MNSNNKNNKIIKYKMIINYNSNKVIKTNKYKNNKYKIKNNNNSLYNNNLMLYLLTQLKYYKISFKNNKFLKIKIK